MYGCTLPNGPAGEFSSAEQNGHIASASTLPSSSVVIGVVLCLLVGNSYEKGRLAGQDRIEQQGGRLVSYVRELDHGLGGARVRFVCREVRVYFYECSLAVRLHVPFLQPARG